MNILSIQSWVAYGHVGNAAALFPLQRLGAEVWAVNTVQFSNHPGYGGFTGRMLGGDGVSELIAGIAARGVLGRLDAVLSGYLGEAATGDAVLEAVSRVQDLRPDALYCCDPVIGDREGGVYVRPGIAALLRDQAVAAADILTPNQFELEQLVPDCRGLSGSALTEIAQAAQALRRRMRPGGARLVLVTSVEGHETPADAIDLLLATGEGSVLLRTPRLPLQVNGAGDMIAALFLLHVLRLRDPVRALELATSAVWSVLRQTAMAGSREPLVVQAQEELVAPSRLFSARAL